MLEATRADEEPLELTRSYWGDALIEFIDEELRGAGDAFIESTTPRSYWGTLL